LFLAVSVGFAACTDTSVHTSDTASAVSDAHVVDGRLTVHVIEAEAGG